MTETDARSRAALIEAIDAELPQTQCGKCGQPGFDGLGDPEA